MQGSAYQTALADYRRAIDEYDKQFTELKGMIKRLGELRSQKLTRTQFKREFETLNAQIDRIEKSMQERDPAKIAIFDRYMSLSDPEESASFYNANRETILSVEALRRRNY
jgi:prefoldin subunit 5